MNNEHVLLEDIIIPAGTKFIRAPNERGGIKAIECVVGMGKDYATYINIPTSDLPDIDILTLIR